MTHKKKTARRRRMELEEQFGCELRTGGAALSVRTGSVLRVILTGPRALHEPIASMQKTGPNTYVLRPMHKHDIYGIELYAGDTIEIVDTPNTSHEPRGK